MPATGAMQPPRLVPSAVMGSRPTKMSTGRVNMDPAPASTLTNPAPIPAANNAGRRHHSGGYRLHRRQASAQDGWRKGHALSLFKRNVDLHRPVLKRSLFVQTAYGSSGHGSAAQSPSTETARATVWNTVLLRLATSTKRSSCSGETSLFK